MNIQKLTPHGFCWGVTRALEKARHALKQGPVFAFHPLVHNDEVMRELVSAGLQLVQDWDAIPSNARILFSAHGVPPQQVSEAKRRGIEIIDATCPFVARAHHAVHDFAKRGIPVVIIGDCKHAEVIGLMGEAECIGGAFQVIKTPEEVAQLPFLPTKPLGVVCQTTLDAEMLSTIIATLQVRYPNLIHPPAADVCTATRDRQNTIRNFIKTLRQKNKHARIGIIIVGAMQSANTKRLAEIAQMAGANVIHRLATLNEAETITLAPLDFWGITSGASTPEETFDSITHFLQGESV